MSPKTINPGKEINRKIQYEFDDVVIEARASKTSTKIREKLRSKYGKCLTKIVEMYGGRIDDLALNIEMYYKWMYMRYITGNIYHNTSIPRPAAEMFEGIYVDFYQIKGSQYTLNEELASLIDT